MAVGINIYQSTDASAPTLSGTAGNLTALLDACLINGYGSQTPPYTTGTTPAWKSNPNSWSPVTNKRVYQAISGNKYYLYIDDSAGTVGANYFLARGYETMTSIADSGTNAFPTTAQMASGCEYIKSGAVSSATRSWVVLASSTFIYIFIDHTATGYFDTFYFGDIYSYKSGDTYNTILSYSNTTIYSIFINTVGLLSSTTQQTGGYIARKYDGISISNIYYLYPVNGLAGGVMNSGQNSGIGYDNPFTYPDPVSGQLIISPIYIMENGGAKRGWLPGIWIPCQLNPLNGFDTFSGASGTSIAGKNMMCLKLYGTNAYNGQIYLELSNTWLSNIIY